MFGADALYLAFWLVSLVLVFFVSRFAISTVQTAIRDPKNFRLPMGKTVMYAALVLGTALVYPRATSSLHKMTNGPASTRTIQPRMTEREVVEPGISLEEKIRLMQRHNEESNTAAKEAFGDK